MAKAFKHAAHLLLVPLLLAQSLPLKPIYVQCSTGPASGSGSATAPFSSLQQARDAIRSLGRPLTTCPAVLISGDCYGVAGGAINYASPSLVLDNALDSGDSGCTISWSQWPQQAPARLLGGAPVPNVWGPADPPILIASLSAMGLQNYDIGDLLQPTSSLGQCVYNRTQLFVGGKSQILARYPNIMENGTWAWDFIDSVVNPTATFLYNDTTGRAAAWVNEPEPMGQGFWNTDWAHGFIRFSNITAPAGGGPGLVSLSNDPATLPVYGYEAMARWQIVNAHSELDAPTEYYIDRARGQVSYFATGPLEGEDVFLSYADNVVVIGSDPALLSGLGAPSGPNGSYVLRNANEIMQRGTVPGGAIQISNPSNATVRYVALSGLQIRYARGNGITAGNVDSVSFTNLTVANHGRQGMFLAGTNIAVSGVEVFDVGCSGILMYGGDDLALIDSGSSITDSTIRNFSQLVRTYSPGLAWGGVGIAVNNLELAYAPHSAVLGTGNDCSFNGLNIHDVSYEVSDSGAFYSGYSWVKRGNSITNSSFKNIQHLEVFHLGAPSIQAIYLDDEMSGWTITGNSFDNAMCGVFVGGGRDNFVANNTFANVGYATHIDDRGLNWQQSSCIYNATYAGRLVSDLYNVKYTQPPYSTRYPEIVNLLQERPCTPVNVTIQDNFYCNATNGFIDVNANQTAAWGDLVINNSESC